MRTTKPTPKNIGFWAFQLLCHLPRYTEVLASEGGTAFQIDHGISELNMGNLDLFVNEVES
jgi:hypothetical protein